MTKAKSICICLASIVPFATACARSAGEAGWLEKHVCWFAFHGMDTWERVHNPDAGPTGMAYAALDLARHAEVPVCIEELPPSPNGTVVPIEIDAKLTTVKDILDRMVSQDPRYEYRERLGVIEVLPQGADRDPADCLNMVIPVFRLRTAWNQLVQQLRCEVDIVSRDPNAVVPDPGCGGSYPGLAHPPPGLIDANFEKQTVRDILTLLCAKVGNMAWSAHFEGPRATCQYISFGAYQPRMWYPSDTGPLTYSQGLPKACIECHYHKPLEKPR